MLPTGWLAPNPRRRGEEKREEEEEEGREDKNREYQPGNRESEQGMEGGFRRTVTVFIPGGLSSFAVLIVIPVD